MAKAVLVVGAGGFIGRRLCKALVAAGRRVVAVTRQEGAQIPDVHHVIVGEPSSDAFEELARDCEGIIWLACTSTPGSTAGRPMAELHENLAPLFALLGGLHRLPPRKLVFISTGGAIYGDVDAAMAVESSVLAPKSYYSAGKAACESFVSAWAHQSAGQAIILRPSNVFGRGQPFRRGFGIIPTAFHAAISGEPLTVWGDGSAVRDYLHVEDFVSLCMKCIDAPLASGVETYNASSGEPTSLNALLTHVEAACGKVVPRVFRASRPVDVERIVLDNARARRTFAWHPQVTLDRGLADAWAAQS